MNAQDLINTSNEELPIREQTDLNITKCLREQHGTKNKTK